MKPQIGKWRDSLGVKLPKHVVEELSLRPGDEISCKVEGRKILIEIASSAEDPTLEELLGIPLEWEGELDWGSPKGEEVW